jgi:hypothetical protein
MMVWMPIVIREVAVLCILDVGIAVWMTGKDCAEHGEKGGERGFVEERSRYIHNSVSLIRGN